MFQDVPRDVIAHWLCYLDAPTPPHFLRLRAAVAESSAYDPASDLISEVEASLNCGRVYRAMEQMQAAMPNYLLCPHLHNMASTAYFSLHDSERSDWERRVSQLLCQSLQETGDGSAERPFLVLHWRDAEDLLEQLQREEGAWKLDQNGEQRFILYECANQPDLWFEVTMHAQQALPGLNVPFLQ